MSFTAVPANTAKPSVPKPTACPKVGKMSAARILNRKITEIDWAISSSSASITGAVAAIAEPPQIDEPTPIRQAVLGLIFAIFITANAVMRDVEIVLIITGRLLLPTLAIVPRLSEKPSMITAHCRIFFEVNFIPPEKCLFAENFGAKSVIIIPVIIGAYQRKRKRADLNSAEKLRKCRNYGTYKDSAKICFDEFHCFTLPDFILPVEYNTKV